MLLAFQASRARAEQVRVIVRQGEQIRALLIQKEGESFLVPMFACEALLEAETVWDRATNRWRMTRDNVTARGFLDEPLFFVSGKPLLVKNPPRLIDGAPYISMEALRILARHAWGAEIVWDEGIKELSVREALAAPVDAAQRVRAITVPDVPPGKRVVVLDPGHPRHGGARITGGMAEGDAGLQLAKALGATISEISDFYPVILQNEEQDLDPTETASLANALQAEAFISFHLSAYGTAAASIWCWWTDNIMQTGVDFRPFEQPGGETAGWTTVASQHSDRSLRIARGIIANAQSVSLPMTGPNLAPLLCLEGLNCPAVAVDIQGAGTPAGISFLQDEEAIAPLAAAISRALVEHLAREAP